MAEKKIAANVNIRVRVAKYEHIDITKYAEQTITYDGEEDMVKQEDQLTDALLDDLLRSMRRIPEKLGKKSAAPAIAETESSISKAIPDWLENQVVPNIANKAKKNNEKVEAMNNAEGEVRRVGAAEVDDIMDLSDSKEEPKQEDKKVEEPSVEEPKEEPKEESKEEPKEESASDGGDGFDLFDDDEDLFK